jgi:hypothetical protein
MLNRIGIVALLLLAGLAVVPAQQADYESLKKSAETYYGEGSYARAQELYKKAQAMKLDAEQARWVRFRLADTSWRSQAATDTSDQSVFDKAQQELQALVSDTEHPNHDPLWAEAEESFGDFYWRRNSQNWSSAWQYYQQAFDYWAGSDDLDTARDRYLRIVWKAAKPEWAEPYYYYGYYGNTLPIDVLNNALKIAQTDSDKAHAHYLLGMSWRQNNGDWNQRMRVPEEFEAALTPGKNTGWYDDSLFYYAEWLCNYRFVQNKDNQWVQKPDYVKALEIYRRLITEYAKGETRYYDQAKEQIKNITAPVLSIGVSNVFLPDSEIQYQLNWRNLKHIDIALYPVDLTKDVSLSTSSSSGDWLKSLSTQGKEPVKTMSKDTGDTGDYMPGYDTMKVGSLPTGAYLMQARSGDTSARDLILVTRASLVVKTSGKQALVYFANAQSGAPIANGAVSLWQHYYDGSSYQWSKLAGKTNTDGIAIFDLSRPDMQSAYNSDLFVAASSEPGQAFMPGYNSHHSGREAEWKIYAFTDRPAYRPDEEVKWKLIARQYNGSVYTTPANQSIEYEIDDPRGSKVKDGKAALNSFGSFWDSLPLTANMPLGEYRVTFYDAGRLNGLGGAVLFRLEEYKLPEFKVMVQTPEKDGKKKTFRLGETVQVNVQADYYFGGPVNNADVELLVYQNPYYHWWTPYRQYAWYYDDFNPYSRYYYGQGSVIKREMLKTDATGKAVLTFDTPRDSQQDFEYRIEARVTDASRREITGAQTVRVTRQRYYVYANPKNYLYRPQDSVSIDIKSLDANEQALVMEGTVKVTRDSWYQIWITPDGKEIDTRTSQKTIPAPEGWKQKFQGYEHEEILTRPVKTDANGEAEFKFTPVKDGYYRMAWSSPDPGGAPVQTETTVWVCTNATTDLGYRTGGLEIIADKDTFQVGETAPVMLAVPTNDRYVLFSVEGDDLYSYQLVHVTGTVKLIQLPIEEKHVPNIFLNAAMISDLQLFSNQKQIIVPPAKNFLDVKVKSDRKDYQPREDGTLTITTRDTFGKPVSAEVALGLVDESVYYIQQDYAGDPRQFYFGEKRSQHVQTQSSLQQKAFARRYEENERDRSAKGGRKNDYDAEGGVVGGLAGGAMADGLAKDEKDQLRSYVSAEAPAPVAQTASSKMAAKETQAPGAKPGEPAVVVRSDFRSTVFWQPDVITDKNGTATVKVTYPDSLTTWKATARAASAANQYGITSDTTRTRKPLIVRLQAPRFFVAGDQVTLSAVINNNTEAPLTVATTLKSEGETLTGVLTAGSSRTVPPGGESRVDWVVNVAQAGTVKLTVTAHNDQYNDAMEKTYDVYEHGIDKFIAKAGKVRSDDVTIKFNLPKERKPGSTTMTVQVTPSLAVTMLDALPYLINYPYGCTEQTMSRFLPSIIVAKTLKDLGLSGFERRLYGGIESSTAAQTHPDGKKDIEELNKMVKAGLDRLYGFQHSDGGWGWWKEGDSDHWMTAYVVWGLTLAKKSGVNIKEDVLPRAVDYLQKELVEEEDSFDMQAWMLHALSSDHPTPNQFETKAFINVWESRDRLNAYTRALLALSAQGFGYTDKAQILIRNLENGVKKDTAPDTSVLIPGGQSDAAVMGTAHWGEDGIYWRWSDGGIEATAFALDALLAIDPQNALVEPVTNWLIKNRRGAQWSNTRDTAIVVMALNDYLRKSGELAGDIEYELTVNGKSIATKHVAAKDVFSAPSLFNIDPQSIVEANEIRIHRKSGKGPLYFAVQAQVFSLEEPITAAGHEIFVKRDYNRIFGKPTLLKGYVYDKKPFNDGETIVSGDRMETVVTIEAKNNYEYLVFEDLKPAGLEAVQIRSGEPLFAQELRSDGKGFTGRTRWVYQELRDRKIALFIDHLPEGKWEIRYDLRAEVPGKFHALPVIGHAMYVPEIRCNGAETHITVADKE